MGSCLRELKAYSARVCRLKSDVAGVVRYADKVTGGIYCLNVAISSLRIIRTKTLVPADERMRTRICNFTPLEGGEIFLEGRHFSSARELYCRRVYFRQPGFEIHNNDIVIDLGANAGLFTTMAAVYGRLVVAVEAQSEFLPVINANLSRNKCMERARLDHALVGPRTGMLSNEAVRAAATHWREPPPTLSVSEIIDKYALDQVDLLKVDIEGSEFDAFAGDLAWLARVRRIVMEIHTDFGDVGVLRRRLESCGFRTTLVDDDSGKVVDQITGPSGYLFARREDHRSGNWVRD